jgi:hypothetical protein
MLLAVTGIAALLLAVVRAQTCGPGVGTLEKWYPNPASCVTH